MLFDAHSHLQDDPLDPYREELLRSLPGTGLVESVVNGSSEEDWPAVAGLARAHGWIRPAFGLHPWYVPKRSAAWRDRLREWLMEFPNAPVGEIGLDRWIENPDVDAQMECFRAQLALAVELERPAIIHCLRAWGLLDETLREVALPARGFLIHSYGGPAEMVPSFVKMGAYFSLSPYFGHERKSGQLATFAQVPVDRLLAESDAPGMWPPDELNEHPLKDEKGEMINHPANLEVSYKLLARLHGVEMEEMRRQIAENYRRFFGEAGGV